jgi:hypothetical protein
MQAVDTSVDGGIAQFMPPIQNKTAGLNALGSALDRITGLITQVSKAVFSLLRGIANTVMGFVNMAVLLLRKAQSMLKAITGFINGVTGFVVGVAKSISQVGREIFKTFASIQGISYSVKSSFMQIGAAFNEVVCVFSNSLRPSKTYEDYTSLYGASNCSSTTGGRMPSAFVNQNVFSVMNPSSPAPVTLSGAAISSVDAINKSDAVLAPLPESEIGRHLDNINNGLKVTI